MKKDTNKYPRFIPDIPVGEDCFENVKKTHWEG